MKERTNWKPAIVLLCIFLVWIAITWPGREDTGLHEGGRTPQGLGEQRVGAGRPGRDWTGLHWTEDTGWTRDGKTLGRDRTGPTMAELIVRRPESVDMNEFDRLAKSLSPALIRMGQCGTLDCIERHLTSVCGSLRRLDDMAYHIEEQIGQDASLAIANVSSACEMALFFLRKGDAAAAADMLQDMGDWMVRAGLLI